MVVLYIRNEQITVNVWNLFIYSPGYMLMVIFTQPETHQSDGSSLWSVCFFFRNEFSVTTNEIAVSWKCDQIFFCLETRGEQISDTIGGHGQQSNNDCRLLLPLKN